MWRSTSILLRSRLRWYALATGRLVLRRWQALLLAVAVLAPAGASALSQAETLGWPVLVLLSPAHGPVERYGFLCLFQVLALVWALMQRDQIRGGEFMVYAQSLPLPPARMRALDSLVLLAANSPLLLFPLAALAALSVQDALAFASHAAFVANLLALAACAQLAGLERDYVRLAPVALANVLLAAAPGTGPALQLLLLAATLPCAWFADKHLSGPFFRPLFAAVRDRRLALASGALPAAGHPAALVPLHYLTRAAPAQALGTFAIAAAVTGAAVVLMALWEFDDRITVLAVIALALVALAISSLYRDLHMAHQAAQPLVAALPLPRRWAHKFDHAVLMLAGTPFAGIVCATMAVQQPQRLLSASLLGAAFLALLGMLRLPQVYTGRHAVVLSSVIAALWGIVCAGALF